MISYNEKHLFLFMVNNATECKKLIITISQAMQMKLPFSMDGKSEKLTKLKVGWVSYCNWSQAKKILKVGLHKKSKSIMVGLMIMEEIGERPAIMNQKGMLPIRKNLAIMHSACIIDFTGILINKIDFGYQLRMDVRVLSQILFDKFVDICL